MKKKRKREPIVRADSADGQMAGETIVEAPLKQVKRVTQHVLRALARANTRDLMKACEVQVIRIDQRSAKGSRAGV